MESGIVKPLKVVWLCHFNNEFITQQLGVKSSFEYAPWISRFAEIFEKHNEVNVHIVAPHNQIIRSKSFDRNNIYYHFFPYLLPYVPRRLFHWLHRNTNYLWNKWIIGKIINQIAPDIIHLFGTENAYFTSSIFQFKNKYPIFITIQGFASHTFSRNIQTVLNRVVEVDILKTFTNFGVRDEEMKNFILSHNPNARFYHHEIAPYKPTVTKKLDKPSKYDIIFFGRVCKEKGIEDLICAVSLIKSKKRDISLVIVGPATNEYRIKLFSLIKNYGIEENVHFEGSKDIIEDVHRIAIDCSICVLPTYADTIPGTIIESMYMGIPCVSYPVGGIPTLNEKEETIKLVSIGDIEGLYQTILLLLLNKEKQNELAEKAKKYIVNRWGGESIYTNVMTAYKKLLAND